MPIIFDQVNFKPKLEDIKSHKTSRKTVHPEAITIINIHAPNANTPNFIKQILPTYRDRRFKIQEQ